MNNGGWGLRLMLVFCFLFVLAILVSAYTLNRNFKSLAPMKNQKPTATYFDIEIKMVNAAKRYIDQTYSDLKDDITIEIKLKRLINSNYLTPVKDPYTKKECNGYVIFTIENNMINYEPYLRCGANYRTTGYESKYEL